MINVIWVNYNVIWSRTIISKSYFKFFKIWEHFLNDISEQQKASSNSYSCWHLPPRDGRTLQMFLYWLKPVKKTHVFRMIHEAGCSHGILYHLFHHWALEINYRSAKPLCPSCEQRSLRSSTCSLCVRWWTTALHEKRDASICPFGLTESHKINIGSFWIF